MVSHSTLKCDIAPISGSIDFQLYVSQCARKSDITQSVGTRRFSSSNQLRTTRISTYSRSADPSLTATQLYQKVSKPLRGLVPALPARARFRSSLVSTPEVLPSIRYASLDAKNDRPGSR